MAIDGQRLMAAGGLLGALAASSCCIVPLVLFGLGVSGAWIGNLTRLAPYQPCFIVATLGFLGAGYWLVFRDSKAVCAEGEAARVRCRTGLSKLRLIVATVLVARRARLRFPCAASSQLMKGNTLYD